MNTKKETYKDINSKCFFLSSDKTKCKALVKLSCDNCKFFKNKNINEEISDTLKHYQYENIYDSSKRIIK
ncbi:MAG: hypothetical protein AB7E09_05610 [Candidatus Izemoplasmatales bacterium]